MFAQSYNPFGVTDSFYLGKQSFCKDEQHRKQHMSPRRSAGAAKRKAHVSHQMLSSLRKTEEDEEEMRQCRLDILRRYMKKCESEHQVEDRRDKETLENDWHSDPGCIPREVNVILSPGSTSPGAQVQCQAADSCLDDVYLQLEDVPHLIGVDDEDEYEDDVSTL